MAITRKTSIARPFGEIPETLSFPLHLDENQEKRLLHLSSVATDVWNFFVQEELYRLDLAKRVKEETALECERILNHKGEMVWDTSISPQSFNYLIKPLRDAFPHIRATGFAMNRGVARKVVDSFASYFALRKNDDPDARKPRFKSNEEFQTLVYLQTNLRKSGTHAGQLVIEKDFVLPVPKSTLEKIDGRDIASIEISRSENKTYLPGTYSCSVVVYQSAPVPQPVMRGVGVDVGSSGLALFDSRGRSFYIKMRRPDYYWRPKIGVLDQEITTLR